jgi:subtilisin family serine protease
VSNAKFAEFNLDPALAEAVAAASEEEMIEGIIRLEDPKQIPPQFRLVSRFVRICTGRFRAADTWTLRRHPNVVSLKAARPLGITQLRAEEIPGVARYGSLDEAPYRYTGRGSMIAMLDFGLDFGHINFLNADGSTRVKALWHQGAPYDVAHPNRYGYGRIFSQQDINAALLESDPYQTLGYLPWISDSGHGSHGTHTTDIAAGNGRALGSRRGVAPEAQILFVHLSTPRSAPGANLGDSVRMLEALDFVHRTAGPRPCAINLSVGRTAGSHDGTSPFEEGMHELLGRASGRAIAQSAGNYRSANLATHGLLQEGEECELQWTIKPQGSNATEIDAWYSGNDRFRVRILSPTGRQWIEAPLGRVVDLRSENGELSGRLYHRRNDPGNHANHIDVFLYPNAPAGPWSLRLLGEYVIDGRYHAWIERETSRSGNQARFDAAIASSSYTLGTIATSPLVLTVGAIDSHAEGSPLASFSSCGPTRDGRSEKPELLAPGVRILAARSIPKDAEQQESLLVELSGTSMAAPCLTGTIAVMFEAGGRSLTIDQIRDCLKRSADPGTDACQDNCCGWGRLNIAAAIGAARELREPANFNARRESALSVREREQAPQMGVFALDFNDGARSEETAIDEDFLDRAESAVRGSYGKRQASEVSFLNWLMRDITDGAPAAGFTPAALYLAALNESSVASEPGRAFEPIGVAAQPLKCELRAGDLMVRRIPGTGDIGHVSVLASGDLLDLGALTGAGIASEGVLPGHYVVVVEAGAFPHTRSRPFARRILDARSRVPPHTLLLRPSSRPAARDAGIDEPDVQLDLAEDNPPSAPLAPLSASASDWTGVAVSCDFTVKADGAVLVSTNVGAPPIFSIPPGTHEVQLTANPVKPPKKDALYWPSTVTLVVSGSDFVPKVGSKVQVKLSRAAGTMLANMRVSRFKEVTADVLSLLSHPPAKRAGKAVDEAADHQALYGSWPPADWDLHAVPDAHFLDLTTPVSHGALSFARDPSLKVEVDSVVLRLAGVEAPQLFAVVWPKSIVRKDKAAPTPIFLFIRQGAGQNLDAGYFKGGGLAAYPDNFDYADTGLFQNLHYGETPLSEAWGSKGVPYQAAKAGANVVTVIPCNSVDQAFGVLNRTEETGKILGELQAFMFSRAGIQDPPASIGKTAIAAFSSGNYYLDNWLKDPTNLKGGFLTNTLSAVYFLDPPTAEIDGFIRSALHWEKVAGGDKRIRLYSRDSTSSHEKLLGAKPPSAPYVKNSSDDKRSAAELPVSSWETAFKNAFGKPVSLDWQFAHHTICATMLTHALAQGDL